VIESSQKKEGKEALRAIIAERSHEDEIIQIDIDLLTTRHLLKVARRLMISVAELSDESLYWKKDHDFLSSFSLSREGIKYLRKEIREELKHRRESTSHWFALLIGLVGATTGLLAIILNNG
jgi:hypothetical protein